MSLSDGGFAIGSDAIAAGISRRCALDTSSACERKHTNECEAEAEAEAGAVELSCLCFGYNIRRERPRRALLMIGHLDRAR